MTRRRRGRSLLLLAVAAAGYAGFEAVRVSGLVRRSRTLTPVAEGEHRVGEGPPLALWVMGDSLAAGYGASDFGSSLAGRVARGLSGGHEVVVTGVARSGATMAEVLEQAQPPGHVDLILVAAGSNDLVRLTGSADLRRATEQVVDRLTRLADRVVVVGPGVVAEAGIIPYLARPLYRRLRPSYVEAMRDGVGTGPRAIHVDPAAGAEALAGEYGDTVSATDRFHLSDEGHRWWADRVLAALGSRR